MVPLPPRAFGQGGQEPLPLAIVSVQQALRRLDRLLGAGVKTGVHLMADHGFGFGSQ
jgi:hypothetical protein